MDARLIPPALWLYAAAVGLLVIPSSSRAHNDPPSCSATGVALEVRVFRSDGVTPVVGAVSAGELIEYQVVLAPQSSGACGFSGGALTLTLPNGSVQTIRSDVPCIGGTTSPCVLGANDLTSALFDYTVSAADASGGVLFAAADYAGGATHDNEPDTPGLAATTPKQTPMTCAGTLCDADPPGCSSTAVSIEVRLFRGDGVTGVVGAVSSCEHLYYQAVLRKGAALGCAISGGTFTLTLPSGVVETISSDSPCIGGTMWPCVSGNDEVDSALLPYSVSPDDVVNGVVSVSADYSGGVAHDGNPGTPGVAATTPKSTPVVLCVDNNACTIDACNPNVSGAAACSFPSMVCEDNNVCTANTCNPVTGCVFPDVINCDDGDPCTSDSCNPITGACSHTPSCGSSTTTTTVVTTTSTTTLAPASIDHFECCKPKGMKMSPVHVALANELEAKGASAVKVDSLCVPVDKDGEGIPDSSTYLTCYKLKFDSGQPRLAPQTITVTDQFGTKSVIAVKGRTLCVPSAKMP